MNLNSAIYTGSVVHDRVYPKKHRFVYNIFMTYLDLDEIDQVFSKSLLWSTQRFNIASFYEEDYFQNPGMTVKQSIAKEVFKRTSLDIDGKIFLLTNLRYLGFVFNPVSFYYCYDKRGTLKVIVSEIENTPWGERYLYVLKVDDNLKEKNIDFEKKFHISPFLPMDLQYKWKFNIPSEHLSTHMIILRKEKLTLTVSMSLEKKLMTTRRMRNILFLYPFMTFKVIWGIYWQAAKLYAKKIPFDS